MLRRRLVRTTLLIFRKTLPRSNVCLAHCGPSTSNDIYYSNDQYYHLRISRRSTHFTAVLPAVKERSFKKFVAPVRKMKTNKKVVKVSFVY